MRLRNEIDPTGSLSESFGYDSFYRLVDLRAVTGRPPFDPSPFAPAGSLPADPIPDWQSAMDLVIGPRGLPPAPRRFEYDLAGNRLSERVPSEDPHLYTINALDQVTGLDGGTLQYDRNGNLTRDDLREYRYDARGRLVRVLDRTSDSTVAQFFYDPLGRRILELEDGRATHLIYHGPHLIAEYRDGACLPSTFTIPGSIIRCTSRPKGTSTTTTPTGSGRSAC